MGPAPMIRMVEMSVRLGIKSHGREIGTKKGRACRASPRAKSAISESGNRFCVRSRSRFIKERMIFAPNRSHFGGSCACVREALARGWSLDQFPHPRNPQKVPINRQFKDLVDRWSPPSLFELRRGSLRTKVACLAEARR